MLKQACPEEILNQVQNDTFRVQHDTSIWACNDNVKAFSALSIMNRMSKIICPAIAVFEAAQDRIFQSAIC
jgi:hypothetical protein